MKKLNSMRFVAPAVCVALLALSARTTTFAQDIRYNAQPQGSKAKIDGTSSVHPWTMESSIIGGFIEADAKFPESALTDAKAQKPKVEAFMPVRQFKSYSSAMDTKMQEAMNEPKFKRIEYKLIELKPKTGGSTTGALQFDATGTLTIAGVTKTNTMAVTIEKKDGKLKVTGEAPLKMTDFGITPPAPSVGLGLIKTGDEVKITFEWTTAPKKE